MIYVELPLWLAIVFAIAFLLIIFYLVFGDFLARLLFKYFKENEEKEEEELK